MNSPTPLFTNNYTRNKMSARDYVKIPNDFYILTVKFINGQL